jgi:hypothetical protein
LAITNSAKQSFLNHALANTVWQYNGAIFMALYTANPTEFGSHMNEVSGEGYARQEVTGFFTVANGSAAINTNVLFPVAEEDWGVINYIGIVDSSNEMLFYGPVEFAVEVLEDDTFSVLANKLVITLN